MKIRKVRVVMTVENDEGAQSERVLIDWENTTERESFSVMTEHTRPVFTCVQDTLGKTLECYTTGMEYFVLKVEKQTPIRKLAEKGKSSVISAYKKGLRVGKREGWSGISTPGMSGGEQNPYDDRTPEYAEWVRGFQAGAAEKEKKS